MLVHIYHMSRIGCRFILLITPINRKWETWEHACSYCPDNHGETAVAGEHLFGRRDTPAVFLGREYVHVAPCGATPLAM